MTKSRRCDIIVGHFCKMSQRAGSKEPRKILKKLFKNPLTNRSGCDIINGSRKTRPRVKSSDRSLIIEQQEIKVQAKSLVRKNLEFLWKKNVWIYHGFMHILKKVKEPNKLDKQILTGNGFNTICSRVWSWLRMNAGGVPNTFKSNEVAIPSGGRVSNAWATCPCVGDTVWKRTLIPHNVMKLHGFITKDLLRKDGLASD